MSMLLSLGCDATLEKSKELYQQVVGDSKSVNLSLINFA
jgi:hypothetical protein